MENMNEEKRIGEMQELEKQDYEDMKLRVVQRENRDVVCASNNYTEEDWKDDNADDNGWT